MHPRTVVNLWAFGGASAATAIWVSARHTLFGEAMPGTEEIIVAGVSGYVITGLLVALFQVRHNEADQTAALTQLCDEMRFTFSGRVEKVSSETTAVALMKPYSAVQNRMRGEVAGVPVEMIDVNRWVERSDDGGLFEWRRTVVLFPGRSELQDMSLSPSSASMGLLRGLTGAHGIDFVGDPAGDRFGRHYVLWPGSRAEPERLRETFTREVLDFFADHPGWNVEAADGQVVMWREDRVILAAARPALLESAAEVYRVLARRSARGEASNVVETIAARPINLGVVQWRFLAMFLCLVTGMFFGGMMGMVVVVVIFSTEPQTPVWVIAVAFFIPSLLGLVLGAFVAFRSVPPRIGNSKNGIITRHVMQPTDNNETHIHSEGSP